MNHLHYVQSLEPLQGGGLGSASLQLHSAICRKGSSSLIATRDANFGSNWPNVFQVTRKGPSAFYYANELKNVAAKYVKEADYIHGHGLYVYPNFIFGREARIHGKPLVYHTHGFFDPWILNRSRWKKKLVGALFENQNLRGAAFFRALTEKEERQIRAVGLKNPIAVIPNGIDLAEADAVSDVLETGIHFSRKRPLRILFLSRLHPKKGLDLLLPVWAKLTKEFPDWELAIVGPDEGGYQATLDKMILDLGISNSCTIFPSVFGELKHQVYRTADLFVLPSYSEGFPMAVLEALAHRIPVVLTTECNVPELAREDAAWECLPEQKALENTLREALVATPQERKQRGEAGRAIVESRYTWDQIAIALENACKTYA